MIRAAGILFVAPDNTALFLKRGLGGDHPNEWAFPGGKTEDDETPAQTAIRETMEETGVTVELASLVPHTRNISNPEIAAPPAMPGGIDQAVLPSGAVPPVAVDFTTFMVRVPEQFTPTLCDEHTGWAWADIANPPEPLHPGARIALARLTMDELGVARAMAAGDLTSPQRYENVTLFAMRITGTGVAYRSGLDEFVYRDPSIYLNDEFLARCNGLPVIWIHPPKATLDSNEFAERIVGMVVVPFIKGNEVWGIAKIYDDDAIKEMLEKQLSTSPTVNFNDPTVNIKFQLPDGSVLLSEGKPSLLDHVAIVDRGVWDKGGEPAGIAINDSTGETRVTEEEKKAAEAAERAKSDAETGDKLDKILSCVDALSTRMDAMEMSDKARKDAEDDTKAKALADKAKKDGEAEGDPERVAADKARKDAEEAEAKEREDKAKKDAEEVEAKAKADSDVAERIARVEAQMPKQMSDADYAAMATTQAKADGVYQAFGDSAPRPLSGETVEAYDKRILSDLKRHSARWKDADIYTMSGAVLGNVKADVYADAAAAARRPTDMAPGLLREVHKTNPLTGGRIIEFVGPNTFIKRLRRPGQRARIEARKVSA